MHRRTLITTTAALAMPHLARAERGRVLRFIPHPDLAACDPVWTSVYVSRNHGYLVFDTRFGQDSALRLQPQMVEV